MFYIVFKQIKFIQNQLQLPQYNFNIINIYSIICLVLINSTGINLFNRSAVSRQLQFLYPNKKQGFVFGNHMILYQ